MNQLQKAYIVLGLEPGLPLKLVEARYKRLVKPWFPDHAHTEQDKRIYTLEMQHINHSRDVIREHFASGSHKDEGPCECRIPDTDELARQFREAQRDAAEQGKRAAAARDDNCTVQLVLQTDFYAAPSPFSETSDVNVRSFRKEGYFHLAVERPGWSAWYFSGLERPNSEVSVATRFVDNTGQAGLVFRHSERGFYAFKISSNGFYTLTAYLTSDRIWQEILAWRFSDALRQGTAQNFLTVRSIGSDIRLSANGILLSRLIDPRFSSGSEGILVSSGPDEQRAEVRFTEFRVYSTRRTPAYLSDFYDSPSPFFEGEDATSKYFRSNGYFQIAAKTPNWMVLTFLDRDIRDIELSVEAQFVGVSGQSDLMGLIFGHSPYGYYRFGISSNGFYQLDAWLTSSNQWTTILNRRPSQVIRQGNAVNTLTVRSIGRQVDLLANGNLLVPAIVHNLTRGKPGLFVSTGPDRQRAEARFRNFRIYSISQ